MYRAYTPTSSQRDKIFHYVYGITPAGKVVYWGPMPQDEADAAASGLISGEVFILDTSQLKVATAAIKAEMLRRGNNPDLVLQRGHHTGLKEFLTKMRGGENLEKSLKHIKDSRRV
jgi:hypothetical protein